MNLSDIQTKCWILALFIRDDGERLLLGDGWFDFKDSLQHFTPNTMANDIVELQGTDGQLLAGQVRRSATQSFDGYVGDASATKVEIESRRRQFLQFFRKQMFFKVIYVFPDGSAIQRKRGYIEDAPSVMELYQRFPEYHVALNFEDVSYYEYAEDDDGNEMFANSVSINLSSLAEGGLIWDGDGAVSNGIVWGEYDTASGDYIVINDGIAGAPVQLDKLNGNTTQTGTPTPSTPIPVETVTGEQTVTVNGQNYEVELGNKNLINESALDARVTSNSFSDWYYYNANLKAKVTAGQTYTLSMKVDAVSVTPYELSIGVGSSSYAADVDTKADIETVGDRIFITFTPTQAQINSGGGNTLFMRCPRYRTATTVSWTFSEIKLEEGDKMTPYSSYMQAPVELCKIGTYQDYIWNDDGTWKIHKETNKIVYDGSNDETWGVANSGTANWLYYTYVTNGADTPNTQMSNIGTYTTITGSNTNQGIQLVSGNLLRVRLGTEQSTSDWRSFLGTDAMLVYYGLTTATDTAITDATLIAQLDAINIVKLEEGTNNIILVPSYGAQGTLEIQYATEVDESDIGYVWSVGEGGGPTNITVQGIYDASPEWIVYGPADNPTLTNTTTGQTITFVGTVPSGQALVVDMGNQTATMEGANMFAYISGDWIRLQPGTNTVSYNASGGALDASILRWNGVVG